MKTVLHKAESRGHADHGWLESYHTFSFANYYNPGRISFGALRVLNDDRIEASKGFGTHPHDNMEIITIPLAGELRHQDNMGNETVIKEGEVQVMSAGTGIFHSEYNNRSDMDVSLLQIWVLPDRKNVTPRYDQITISDIAIENEFYQVLSPSKDDQGVWIYQDAWFHFGKFEAGKSDTYNFKKEGNGLYIFVLEGEAEVEGRFLERRDGYGVWDTNIVTVNATKDARLLLIEVPMN